MKITPKFKPLYIVLFSALFNLKTALKPFAKKINNKRIRNLVLQINGSFNNNLQRNTILGYFKNLDKEEICEEKREVFNYLKCNPFHPLPYKFTEKYKNMDTEVFVDPDNKLKYILVENKRLYFKRSHSEKAIKEMFSILAMEQDIDSPHRYLIENYTIQENDILADFGAAEGDFTLSAIEKVKKAFIFESDPEMIEAITATFAPWKEKVVIVDKYIANEVSEKKNNIR